MHKILFLVKSSIKYKVSSGDYAFLLTVWYLPHNLVVIVNPLLYSFLFKLTVNYKTKYPVDAVSKHPTYRCLNIVFLCLKRNVIFIVNPQQSERSVWNSFQPTGRVCYIQLRLWSCIITIYQGRYIVLLAKRKVKLPNTAGGQTVVIHGPCNKLSQSVYDLLNINFMQKSTIHKGVRRCIVTEFFNILYMDIP